MGLSAVWLPMFSMSTPMEIWTTMIATTTATRCARSGMEDETE